MPDPAPSPEGVKVDTHTAGWHVQVVVVLVPLVLRSHRSGVIWPPRYTYHSAG